MAIRFDIALNNNDAIIVDNDLQLVESDTQHIVDTINANAGWWKENYTDGVGIINFLKGRGTQQLLSKKTKINLQSDGYNSRPIVERDNLGKLILDPNVTV
jgi:hypothetical protein